MHTNISEKERELPCTICGKTFNYFHDKIFPPLTIASPMVFHANKRINIEGKSVHGYCQALIMAGYLDNLFKKHLGPNCEF